MSCEHSFSMTVSKGIRDWEMGVPGEYSYKECAKCGLVRLEPFPSLQDLISYYPDDYPAFNIGGHGKGFIYNFLYKLKSKVLRRKVSQFMIVEDSKVLDVGCGSGEMLSLFKSWGSREIHGIDFSAKACEIAKSKSVMTHRGTFLDYNKEKNSFDAIIMHHYIEHTLEPENELKLAYEYLKESGVLIMELPNFRSLDRFLFGRFWGGNHIPRHTFQFKDIVLKKMLKDVGFDEVVINHEINPAHFVLSIQNWMQFKRYKENPPGVSGGRAWYFSLLLLLLVPVQIISKLFRSSGMISVMATK